jgi:hypothetical protein
MSFLSFNLAGLVVLALLVLYAFFKVDRTKTTAWMVANVVWLVGFGYLAFHAVNWYLGLGLVAAAAQVVASFVSSGTSVFSNLMGVVVGAVKNVFFYPVVVFEELYGFLKSKV